MVEMVRGIANSHKKALSSAWAVDGITTILAFVLLGLICGKLLTGTSNHTQEYALKAEGFLLFITGTIALFRFKKTSFFSQKPASGFAATRLLVDQTADSTELQEAIRIVVMHARMHTESELASLAILGQAADSAQISTFIGNDIRTGTLNLFGKTATLHHRALTEGKQVIINGGSQLSNLELPPYCPPIDNFLAVPVKMGNEIQGELFVANKDGSYDNNDLACLATLAGVLAPHITNHRLLNQVRQGYQGTVEALVKAIEAKDAYTKGHSENVALYAMSIAREIGYTPEQIDEVRVGGVLHDVGKIAVPESIINKTSSLTDDEWALIREHPRVAAKILDPFNASKDVLAMVYHHHESFNGKGYPSGLKGNDIPLSARILKVADSYEAMTSDRAYRVAMTSAEAIQELKACSGTQFDPAVVNAFIRAIAKDPRLGAKEKHAPPTPRPRNTKRPVLVSLSNSKTSE